MTWTGIIFLAVGCSSGSTTIPGFQFNSLPLVNPVYLNSAGGSTSYSAGCEQQEAIGTYDSADACIKAVRAIVDKPQIKAISGGECSARVDQKSQ